MSAFWSTAIDLISSGEGFGLPISLFFKGSVILLLAALANYFLRRNSAAIRHWIWCLAFFSLLLVLPLSSLLPEKSLPLLPRIPSAERGETLQNQSAMQSDSIVTVSSSYAKKSGFDKSVKFSSEQDSIDTNLAGNQALPPTESAPPVRKDFPWFLLVFWVWIAVGIALIVRFVWSLVRIHSLSSRGEEIRDKRLGFLLRECLERFRLRASVRLVVHPQLPVPAALGLIRPVLILPEDVYSWSEDKQRTVICHELAHIKRFDFLTNVLVQIACALNWFNPLVWLSMRQICVEREMACDDFVLRGGTPNCEYADMLVGMARGLPRMNNLGRCALVLAHYSGLKKRIKHILSSRTERQTVTWRAIILTSVIVMLIFVPLTMAKIAVKEFQEKVQIQKTKSLQDLIQDLKSNNPEVQKRAAWALGDKEDEKAVPALVEVLEDKDPEIRGIAAWALGEIKDLKALLPLIEALPDKDDYAREMIIKSVGEFENEQGVGPLVGFLDDKSPDVRAAVVWALGEIPCQESQNAILSVLDDSSALVRDSAVVALARFKNQKSMKNLIPMLRDRNAKIRERAAFVLGNLEERQAVEALIESLNDKDVNVRISAAVALGEIGDSLAVDSLMKRLRDENARVRDAVVWALDEISLN